jgi:hypothetical protein
MTNIYVSINALKSSYVFVECVLYVHILCMVLVRLYEFGGMTTV